MLRPHEGDRPALVLVRLFPNESSMSAFLSLTRRIGDLTAEIGHRRRAEAAAAAAFAGLQRTEQRLGLIIEATHSLLGAAALTDALQSVGDLVAKSIPADAHAVWCYDPVDTTWKVQWQRELSESFISTLSATSGSAAGAFPFDHPVAIPDSTAPTLVEVRRAAYVSEGIESLLVIPLRIRDAQYGTAVAYYRMRRTFDESDLRVAGALGNIASSALTTTALYEDARRANQLKDDFLATLSHELRTPLNAILGYTRMLRDGAIAAGRQPAALAVVERNATALCQIVEDVLDVSRIVAGKVRLNVQPVDLASAIGDGIATIMPAADAKGVQVSALLDPAAPTIAGDPDRLQQILWNLLSNAVKFTPRGGRVEVRLGIVDGSIEIIVSDSGAGIPAAFLPYLFERFRQADSRATREHGGLGLGLAIARHLVELHGGSITATSGGEGQGATFRVRLPTATPIIS